MSGNFFMFKIDCCSLTFVFCFFTFRFPGQVTLPGELVYFSAVAAGCQSVGSPVEQWTSQEEYVLYCFNLYKQCNFNNLNKADCYYFQYIWIYSVVSLFENS